MIYVALLRGINVGGKSKVEMAKLKELIETIGCSNVRTYINSGNVVLADDRSADRLAKLIEQAVFNEFTVASSVIMRDLPTMQALCRAIPGDWTNDSEQKTDVIFLQPSIDNPDVLSSISHNPALEHALYKHGAIVWNIARSNVTRGGGIKLVKTDLYNNMTVRNINTTRKLLEIMRECQKN